MMNSHSLTPYDSVMNTPTKTKPAIRTKIPMQPPIPYEEWKPALVDEKFGCFNTVIVVSKRQRILTKFRMVRLSADEDVEEKILRVYQDLKINYAEQKSYNDRHENSKFSSNIDILLNQIRLSKGPVNVTTIQASNDQVQITQLSEYLNGRDLKRYQEKRVKTGIPFSTREIFFVIQTLTAGLLYLHNAGVLHRDVSMKNILVNYHVQNDASTKFQKLVSNEIINRVVISNFTRSKHLTGSVTYMGDDFDHNFKTLQKTEKVMHKPPEGFLHVPFYDQKYDVFQMGLVIWGLFCDKSHPYELSKEHNEEIERYRRTRKVDRVLLCLINIYMKNHGTPRVCDIKKLCGHNIWLQTEFLKQVKEMQVKNDFGEIIPEIDSLEIIRKKIKIRVSDDGLEKTVRNGEYCVEPALSRRYEKLKSLLRSGSHDGYRIIDLIKEMLEFMPENRITSKTAFTKVQEITEKILKTDKFHTIDPEEFCKNTCFDYSKEIPSGFNDFSKKFDAMHGQDKRFKVLRMPEVTGDDLAPVYLIIQSVKKIIEKMDTPIQTDKNVYADGVSPEKESSLETFLNCESTKNTESIDAIKTRFKRNFKTLFPYDFGFDEFTAFYWSESKETGISQKLIGEITTEIFKHWRPAFFGEFNALENKYAIETERLVKSARSQFVSKTGFCLDMLINWHGVKHPLTASDLVLEVLENGSNNVNYGSCWQNQVDSFENQGFSVVVVKCLELYFVAGFRCKNAIENITIFGSETYYDK